MLTHFPFNIYVEYEFENLEHYFNVFWCFNYISTNCLLNCPFFHSYQEFLSVLRVCLHVKFHPRLKLVQGWNHPCLWWNVCYCLHVFAGMKDRDEISSWGEKKKKRRVNTSSQDEILKWACFFNFWRMYSSMFSKFNMFEHNESLNIMKHKASL